MQKSNFHTHTIYSDGEDTVREMIETAVDKGFTALGFSDHSFAKSELDYCMKADEIRKNYNEIRSVGNEYRDRLAVYCGIELDAESERPEYLDFEYDFIISSVHEIVRRGVSMPVDASAELQIKLVNELFGGDWGKFAGAYYAAMINHVSRNNTDIVGHLDLVTKYGLMHEDERYVKYAIEAVHEIVKTCKTFELNTGAMARGYRSSPYPAEFIIDEIKKCGGQMIITSDCHQREKLDCWFDEAEKLLTAHGFVKNECAALNGKIKNIEIWQ